MPMERIQKILAQAGLASRRKAEEWITEGRVTVNGQVAKLGDKADAEKDFVKLDGKRVGEALAHSYIVFHKPRGVISMMHDPEGRPALQEFLQGFGRKLNPVGRLDFNMSGIVLLTNDGELSDRLQKAKDIIRIYEVKIKGEMTHEYERRLSYGIQLGEKRIKPQAVFIKERLDKKTIIELVFRSSRSFDLKEFLETKGFLVERMTLIQLGNIKLSGTKSGEWTMSKKQIFEAELLKPYTMDMYWSEHKRPALQVAGGRRGRDDSSRGKHGESGKRGALPAPLAKKRSFRSKQGRPEGVAKDRRPFPKRAENPKPYRSRREKAAGFQDPPKRTEKRLDSNKSFGGGRFKVKKRNP